MSFHGPIKLRRRPYAHHLITVVEHASDFELFSSTGAGVIQGNGYQLHADGASGPRLLRLYEVDNFSIHDIILVDAPVFHLVMDTCDSGEVYNMLIRGGDMVGQANRITLITN